MRRILFFITLVFLVLSSCRKDETPSKISYKFNDVKALTGFTSCIITCRNVSVDGEGIKARLLLSESEDLADTIRFPIQVRGDTLLCNITSLMRGTTYYYGFEMFTNRESYLIKNIYSFKTQEGDEVTVTTFEINNITQTTAKGGGSATIDSTANNVITERGVCWSTNHNPTTNDSLAHNGAGEGSYTVNMTGLNANTTYYVRAYAISNQGTTYGNEVSFTTLRIVTLPTVTTTQMTNITQTTAKGGGNVTSDGDATVTERGICWSTSHNPTISNSHASSGTGTGSFTVNMTGLTANTTYYVRAYATNSEGTAYGGEKSFTTTSQQTNFTIGVSASPSNGGTVSGGGTYQQGQSCTVRAVANSGYSFVKWTENGTQVSTNANYTFTVNGNRSLVAIFNYNGGGNAPTGAINGLFTINSSGGKVYFSQGNLQYQASSNTWRFANNQWDYVGGYNYGVHVGNVSGSSNSNISSTYSGWIDLFGWGTSGWNSGNTYYHPWDSNNSSGSTYGPPGQYDLTGSYANADWGVYNPISNGGNNSNTWRTLTSEEWLYVFNKRSGYRYAYAQIETVDGMILLPDSWNANIYHLNNYNQSDANFSSNLISSSQWSVLENAGAVFLPAGGSRTGTSVNTLGGFGAYWSASYSNSYRASYVYFWDGCLYPQNDDYRNEGLSVRLVQDLR